MGAKGLSILKWKYIALILSIIIGLAILVGAVMIFTRSSMDNETSSMNNETDSIPSSNPPPNYYSPPNTKPPAIMLQNVLFYYTGSDVTVDAGDEDYLGRVLSVVSITELPSEEGQLNMPYLNAPYIAYENGIALYINDQWMLFEPR